MAILNVTPDSFSDGGQLCDSQGALNEAAVLKRMDQLLAEGFDPSLDIIDVGGESTRPGARLLGVEEELARILPVLDLLCSRFSNFCISVDTRKAKVAQAALDAGASMINDVSGLQFDEGMAAVVARAGCPLVLMHSVGTPETMQSLAEKPETYPDGVVEAVKQFFKRQLQVAQEAGILKENLILDPGFGFGKTQAHHLTLLQSLNQVKRNFAEYPLLVGISRKSFLTLGDKSILPSRRETLTAATTYEAVVYGNADIVRIHDVKSQLPVIVFAEASQRCIT